MVNQKYVPEFWGLDLETSGTNYTKHVTIQVGLVAPNGEVFNSLVGGWQWSGDPFSDPLGYPAVWEEEAFGVHNISKEQLLAAPNKERIDAKLVEFIQANSTTKTMQRIPVGWNVAGFDMYFFRKDFPKAGKLLSYRSADLNSIIFGMIRQDKSLDYNKIKDKVKRLAAEEIGGESKWHDAAFDAQAGLVALKHLAQMLGKEIG